jgi:hypothetical protein
MKTSIALCVAAATSIFAGAAMAAPPANIGGTTWTLQANRSTDTLVITAQGGAGAPGAAVCRVLIGTVGIAPVRGWYCPSTGRIHLRHNNIGSGATVRTFTGNLSDQVAGQPLYMAGTMAIENAAFGNLGEYNFSATD